MDIGWVKGLLALMAELCLGYVLADFATGVIHWFEDRYGKPHWPVLGPSIRSNQLHHERPLAFLDSPVWRRNREVWIVCLVMLGLFWLTGTLSPVSCAFCMTGAFANEIHGAAHRPASQNPRWVRRLQRWRLIQHPLQHAAHHRAAKDSNYCTMTNWVNPLLDRAGFFRALEHLIYRATGARPRHDPTVPERFRPFH